MRPDPQPILDLANAFYGSCVLFSASDAGIFAALAESGGADIETLCSRCGLDLRGGRLLADACVAVGLLEKSADHMYANTPAAGAFLAGGGPGDLSKAIRYNRDVYPAWGKLGELVRTGRPVESPQLHLGDDADRTRNFVLAMQSRAMAIGQAVIPQLDLAGRRTFLDVGGGPGTYSCLAARANPELQCTVLDLPAIVAIAAELITEQGLAERVATVSGDYHTAQLPAGQDVVALFGMLHQESPEQIADLLSRSFEAMNPGGVVYVLDMMTDATRTAPAFSALFAVNMALTTENGWVFSDEDLRGWLAQAGFEQITVGPLAGPMPHWLARAVKPA